MHGQSHSVHFSSMDIEMTKASTSCTALLGRQWIYIGFIIIAPLPLQLPESDVMILYISVVPLVELTTYIIIIIDIAFYQLNTYYIIVIYSIPFKLTTYYIIIHIT